MSESKLRKIEAIIRPEMLGLASAELEKIGVIGMTVTRVEGRGRQKGLLQRHDGSVIKVDFLPKIKIELYIEDKDTEKVCTAIREATLTGEVGDGKIIVYPIEEIIKIRTNEKNTKAI
jgi:nitrogen regulatory protein P-II 1